MKIINVAGARPNFMKIAPIIEEMNRHRDRIDPILVHTGQHYDEKMSESFFDDLGIPKPDINLEVGSGSHAEQTARVMVEFEKVCLTRRPDLVVVVGDVNSTMACTITAKKLGIRVAHVEAGLRSRDMSMPEEINRLCTDVLCDYLFTTDRFADWNLLSEGIPKEKIFFVGNVMIDTLLKHREMARGLGLIDRMGLKAGEFAVLTMHRPSNVDDLAVLGGLMEAILEIAGQIPVVFPIHPRTRKILETSGFNSKFKIQNSKLSLVEPLGYLEFLHLTMHSRMVLTDSGGLQEETTVLGIPCITMRNNTERPITCEVGTNFLVGNRPEKVLECVRRVLSGNLPKGQIPEKWDGKAAQRIVRVLLEDAMPMK